MSEDTTKAREAAALEKLELLLESDKLEVFDEEEVVILKRVINLVKGLDALGSFATFAKNVVIWLGVIIGGYFAIRNGIIEFILSVVNKG